MGRINLHKPCYSLLTVPVTGICFNPAKMTFFLTLDGPLNGTNFFQPICNYLLQKVTDYDKLSSTNPFFEVPMIRISRKDQMEALKWSKHRSPLAYLVYFMNGKWGTDHDNDENILSNFLKLWAPAKGAIIVQGKKRLEDLSIFVPSTIKESSVKNELATLLVTMPARLKRAERYEELKDFCWDMSNLFIWDQKMQDTWEGYILTALDGQGKYEECDQLYGKASRSEELASMYAECLLKRLAVDRASEVLEPYKASENPDIIKQRTILSRIQNARNR